MNRVPLAGGRVARALGNAGIACFDSRPSPAPDGESCARLWQWSGAAFGVPGIAGPDGLACLIEAVAEGDRASLRRLLTGDPPAASRSVAFRLVRPGGRIAQLQCHAYAEPGNDAERGAVFGTVRDITQEQQFESELTEIVRRNQMLLATIDACPLSITVCDAGQPDFPLIYANRKFLDLTGYDAAEVIGRNCRFLQGPATDAEAVRAIRHSIAAGEQCEIQLMNYTKSGTQFLNRLILAPIHDDAGVLTAYLGLQADTTLEKKRKDAEAQRQKMEALGRMMGGVAHEINNMLQPVTLLAQHLVDQDLVHEEGRANLAIVLECSLKARHIIGDLLAFSRPSASIAELLDPAVLLGDSLRLVRQAIPPGITLSVQIPGQPPPIRIGRTAFIQIMLNLATNAAAAMNGSGELAITLEAWQPRPAVGGTREAAGVRLRVSDTGCGMDRMTLDRAFEPFFTTKPVGQGTGLGLPVVYGMIREVGGTIALDSEPGRGTTVTIFFPSTDGVANDGLHPGG